MSGLEMNKHLLLLFSLILFPCLDVSSDELPPVETLNRKDDGYRGIWYMNQPSGDQYVYKYSGGLGTYCAKHKPFAVYCEQVNKTFFCYGGTAKDSNRRLLHMVSYFDHQSKQVPRPTILLDKNTSDAHDNPVISVDDQGFIWIFSTSHGTSRPSFIHRSKRPYDIDEFERVAATRLDGDRQVPITNFSYMQAWHVTGRGFVCFFTRYSDPAARTICCMTSRDGMKWDEYQRLATIDQGHYQISAVGQERAGSAFNYHPKGKGLNWRTNLYYVETTDFGKTWRTVDGVPLKVPLKGVNNSALVHDYESKGLNVYLKDIRYDSQDRPIILYVTSKGYQSGPANDPRTWTTARWTGSEWDIRPAMVSDNNYDMGSLWIESNGTWRIIAPTETGPQPYNPGGEIALWTSTDQGKTWRKTKQLTSGSERNHTYVRRPLNAHPDFFALWADGHGRKPSLSKLYFSNEQGDVRCLPRKMEADFAAPVQLAEAVENTSERFSNPPVATVSPHLHQFFRPPPEYANDFGDYRTPLKFDDGRSVQTEEDWRARRNEILDHWHAIMGRWPPLVDRPKIEYLEKVRRENFTQHLVRIEIAPSFMYPAILLVPDGKGPFAAAVVPFYWAESGAGLREGTSDFGYQLTKRGFVTLSIGMPSSWYYPNNEKAELQPLSALAYGAANCHSVLANLPNVDDERIGIVGHSYGGKWAMFASCLYDKFACAAWSDGGIVFDEGRANVNYWEPWYLGYEPGKQQRAAGIGGFGRTYYFTTRSRAYVSRIVPRWSLLLIKPARMSESNCDGLDGVSGPLKFGRPKVIASRFRGRSYFTSRRCSFRCGDTVAIS
jgi:hypothetical protein